MATVYLLGRQKQDWFVAPYWWISPRALNRPAGFLSAALHGRSSPQGVSAPPRDRIQVMPDSLELAFTVQSRLSKDHRPLPAS